MKRHSLANLYAELPLPVLVCRNSPGLPVEYMNVQAVLLLAPSYTLAGPQGETGLGRLADILRFETVETADTFQRNLISSGVASSYSAQLRTADNTSLPITIYANLADYQENEYFVLYLMQESDRDNAHTARLADIISAALLEENVDASINTVLALAGMQAGVSRVYIFENGGAGASNSYEWCASGVEPSAQNLRRLLKDAFPADVIIETGMFVVNNITGFEGEAGRILEEQGVRSFAILPIYGGDGVFGYVCFEDVENPRQWSHDEVQFLKSVTMPLASLIKRRDPERIQRHSQNILQTITDNSEDIIYANRLSDYSLLFASASLARVLHTTEQKLLGRPCYEVLYNSPSGPCAFCPIPHIKVVPGAERGEIYEWENRENDFGKVYLSKDNIVRWIDGTYVHMQVATDITQRIEYEENLRHVASIDTMTGIYNREWGTRALEEKLADQKSHGCLCFIDLDGLKKVNDTLGHALGDEFINETVNVVSSSLPEGSFMCRWGGDEFIAWVNLDEKSASDLMERVTRKAGIFNMNNEKPYRLAFSYGVMPANPGDTLDILVTRADKRMYESKMKKRGVTFNRRREDRS